MLKYNSELKAKIILMDVILTHGENSIPSIQSRVMLVEKLTECLNEAYENGINDTVDLFFPCGGMDYDEHPLREKAKEMVRY